VVRDRLCELELVAEIVANPKIAIASWLALDLLREPDPAVGKLLENPGEVARKMCTPAGAALPSLSSKR